MKVPTNLFILGAPKCGTTSLASWLAQHPDIYMPIPKEPHFFYSPTRNGANEAEYLRIFKESWERYIYRCDASTSYLFGEAYRKILCAVPSARFIVCVRNPIEILPSMYNEQKNAGFELAPSLQAAWTASGDRWAGTPEMLNTREITDPRFFSLQHQCALGWQLEKLVNYVGLSRVYVVHLNEMRLFPNQTFRNVCRWLRISDNVEIEYLVKNAATSNRSEAAAEILRAAGRLKRRLGFSRSLGIFRGASKLNEKSVSHASMSEELIVEAQAHFREDSNLLDRIMRDLENAREA